MIHARALYRLKATLIYIYIYTSFCIVLGYIPSKHQKQKPLSARKTRGGRLHIKWKFQLEATCSANKTYFFSERWAKNRQLTIYIYIYILKTVVAQPLEHCFGKLCTNSCESVCAHWPAKVWLPALTAVVDFSFLAYFGWLNIL